jgi:hypothetical protein
MPPTPGVSYESDSTAGNALLGAGSVVGGRLIAIAPAERDRTILPIAA